MAKTHESYPAAWLTAISCTLASGFGCSSSSKPAAAPGVTSVDQNKVLSSLTADEMQTLCSDFNSYLVQKTSQEYAARICIQSGLVAAGLSDASLASQACHTAYDKCIIDPANTNGASGISITAICPSAPSAPSCSMTVSQYIECLNELIPAAQAAWELQSTLCDNLNACSGLCNSPLTLPAACSQVGTTCPGMVPTVGYTTVS